jgi:hypothetical protein
VTVIDTPSFCHESPPCDAVQFEAMAHDPFAPPRAELELDEDLGPVPMRIRVAVMAIITAAVMSFALKCAAAAGLMAYSGPQQARASDILPAALPLILVGTLAWKIFVGRDWARWIFTAIVGLGAVGLAAMLYMPSGPEPLIVIPRSQQVASVIHFAFNFTAVVLLFTGDAGKWFRH